MFRLRFHTDNDVFRETGYADAEEEAARILRVIADQIAGGCASATIWDANGNDIGSYKLTLPQG